MVKIQISQNHYGKICVYTLKFGLNAKESDTFGINTIKFWPPQNFVINTDFTILIKYGKIKIFNNNVILVLDLTLSIW